MKIVCPHCRQSAKITHSNPVADNAKIREVYGSCRNPDCAARFVYRLAYSHDITPPLDTLTCALHEIIANLPDAEKRDLLQRYCPPPFIQPRLL